MNSVMTILLSELHSNIYLQIIIQQLKDKLENTKQQIENKTTDIDINSKQLTELKSQLTDLIDSCEKLYMEYDMQRIQVRSRPLILIRSEILILAFPTLDFGDEEQSQERIVH